MLYIYFNENKAQQKSYSFGVQNNNNANVIRFLVNKEQGEQTLEDCLPILKLQNKEGDYLDLIDLSDNMIVNGAFIEITWVIQRKTTQYKNLELQLQFEKEEDFVWQSEIFELQLSNTIKASEVVSQQNATVIDQLIQKVNSILQNNYAQRDSENQYTAFNQFNAGFYASSDNGYNHIAINDDSISVYSDHDIEFYAGLQMQDGDLDMNGNIIQMGSGDINEVALIFGNGSLTLYNSNGEDSSVFIGEQGININSENVKIHSYSGKAKITLDADGIKFESEYQIEPFYSEEICNLHTGIPVEGSAPNSDFNNPNFGARKVVILDEEPENKYNGYIYIITEE